MTTENRDFAEHRAAIWAQFEEALQGDFLKHKNWVTDRLIMSGGEWKVALDFHQHAGYRSAATYTRFHAPFLSDNKFQFMLRGERFEDRVGKLFGLKEIEIGEKKFDKMFLIKSNYSERLTTILGRDPLREALMQEKAAILQLHGDHGYWSDHYEKTTRDVSIEVHGRIKEPERLKRIYDILAEMIEGICETHGQTE